MFGEKRSVYIIGAYSTGDSLLKHRVSKPQLCHPFIDFRGTIKWNMRASMRLKIYSPKVPVELSIFTHMTNTQPFDCDHLEPPPPTTRSKTQQNTPTRLYLCVIY